MINMHPALFFIAGAALLPLINRRPLRNFLLITIPLISLLVLFQLTEGYVSTFKFFTYEIMPLKVDRLSLVFAYVFVIAAFTSFIFALHVRKAGEHVAALLYVGGALGVTFAGDWITLLISWELMAISSVFLIWYRSTSKALAAGFRYLMVHLIGGTLLLAGIILHLGEGGNFHLSSLPCEGLSAYLILTAFIINAAVPPLHAWLTDAYPEATVTGSVFLSAFTTKSAVYILLRVFPGAEILVWLGTAMALYGIIYAVLENDIRRLLSYHIVSQVGYMVCGVGLGTALSMNGACAHAFCHILYKALLFMGVGVVIEATGKSKLTDLQGKNLFHHLPAAFYLYMIGAFSISGVPLFNGFVSKTMIVASAGEIHRPFVHIFLHLASIGTFLHTGLKLPYGTWFGKAWQIKKDKKEIKAKKTPPNMLLAMAMNAFLCIFIGIYPEALYQLLPYQASYQPYSVYTVATTLQLLVFTYLAFLLFLDKLGGERTISIDTDWFYRKGAVLFTKFCDSTAQIRTNLQKTAGVLVDWAAAIGINPFNVFSLGRKRTEKIPFDPDLYRPPIGVALWCFLTLFSFFFIFLLSLK